MNIYDVLILGSGPAGLTAAIYTGRANLRTLLFSGAKPGGQLILTSDVENFPGFPEGVLGAELMKRMREQAEKYKATIVNEMVTKVNFKNRPFEMWVGDTCYKGKTVILATGAEARWLGIPSEKRFIGRGISSCATCDAFFYRDKQVVVVGGGDAALEEALYLTKFATSVMVIHRRESLRASKIMQDRAFTHPKIKFVWNSVVEEILGSTNKVSPEKVTGIKIKNIVTNEVTEIKTDGVFVAIGHVPNSELFSGQIDLDEKGYVKKYAKEGFQMLTNIDGIFAAGDIHDYHYRQAITAAAFGSMAAIEAEKWLEGMKTLKIEQGS